MGDDNYLKELKLWLCASLKNSNAELNCSCTITDTEEIINKIDDIILLLQELKQLLTTHNEKDNKIKCGKDDTGNKH